MTDPSDPTNYKGYGKLVLNGSNVEAFFMCDSICVNCTGSASLILNVLQAVTSYTEGLFGMKKLDNLQNSDFTVVVTVPGTVYETFYGTDTNGYSQCTAEQRRTDMPQIVTPSGGCSTLPHLSNSTHVAYGGRNLVGKTDWDHTLVLFTTTYNDSTCTSIYTSVLWAYTKVWMRQVDGCELFLNYSGHLAYRSFTESTPGQEQGTPKSEANFFYSSIFVVFASIAALLLYV
jgi:hypothetical protein